MIKDRVRWADPQHGGVIAQKKCLLRVNTFCKLGNKYFQEISQLLSHVNSSFKKYLS